MTNTPDFFIIGAMKAATSTLYTQLKQQEGIFFCEPKEPNFFSDDQQFNLGLDWYHNLFKHAQTTDLIGDASTHYSKLPTYPNTVARLKDHIASPKFIYIMRHPVDRLISHYIHEWSQKVISCNLNQAIELHPELISYSCYAQQLQPYITEFGTKAILPVFFENLRTNSQTELERICNFIGYQHQPTWYTEMASQNVSQARIRKFPLYNLLIESKLATQLRQNLVPVTVRNFVKNQLTMQTRPELTPENLLHLTQHFDTDLQLLGRQLGIELNCENFNTLAMEGNLQWQL